MFQMQVSLSLLPGPGELTCTASNSIGAIKQPCTWKIKQTGNDKDRIHKMRKDEKRTNSFCSKYDLSTKNISKEIRKGVEMR